MTVRLSHRQKPDTQNYVFQALGSPFSLTGIASSLRAGFRVSIPDKIPYILTGQSAALTWAAAPVPPTTGLSITYNSSEGYTTTDGLENGPAPRTNYPGGGQMWYESAYTTKDGTIIEAFTGEHGTFNNRIGEWNPSSSVTTTPAGASIQGRAMAEVFPNNFAANGVSGYDNLSYLYFDAIDSLVVFSRGQYDRTVANVNGSAWTRFAWSPIGAPSWPSSTNIPPSPRPPLHSATDPTALIYVPAAVLDSYQVAMTYFNPHMAYSRQFDVGIVLGGAQGSSRPDGYYMMTVFIPSRYISSSIAQRYTAIHRQLSVASAFPGGKQAILSEGRAGCKFVGRYVYWCGGGEDTARGGGNSARLWRMDILNFLNSPDPMNAPFVAEEMAPCPVAHRYGALSHDPYSNTLILLNGNGVYLYDIAANAWQTITGNCAEYVSAFASTTNYLTYPHADFVDFTGATKHRKTFFFGGWTGNIPIDGSGGTDASKFVDRFQKVRSIQVTRTGQVGYLTIEVANPENPAANTGNIFLGMKHQSLLAYGSGTGKRLQLWSGDWGGYPYNTASPPAGYKPEGTGHGWDSGRQEIWRADIGGVPAIGTTGTVRFTMVHNAYAGYPWTGSAASFPAAQKGPYAPDGIGQVQDKRGKFWMGPCYDGDSSYVGTSWELAGNRGLSYAPMYSYADPAGTNTTGFGDPDVALGTGWTLPSQDRLRKAEFPGTAGVDYDVGDSFDGATWGRAHSHGSVYDATNDKIYALGLRVEGGNKRIGVQLYAFNCVPDGGGVHRWTKSAWVYANCKSVGGPSDNQYTGMNNFGGASINNAPALIGRRLYFAGLWLYSGLQNGAVGNVSPNNGSNPGALYRTHLMSIDVDNPGAGIEWIPLPESQNWWVRSWDGPLSLYGTDTTRYPSLPFGAAPLSPAEKRSMAVVGTKLVLGPDWHTKPGVDPWIQVYDTVNKTWTSFQPPSDSDYPMAQYNMVAVPELGEVWLAGTLTTDFVDAFTTEFGLYQPPSNAGRRIVRFKVA